MSDIHSDGADYTRLHYCVPHTKGTRIRFLLFHWEVFFLFSHVLSPRTGYIIGSRGFIKLMLEK